MAGGDFQVKFQTQNIIREIENMTPKAVHAALVDIKKATDPLTPRKTGALIASGRVQVNQNAGSITYDQPYAVPQHEIMHYKHAQGGPKYLARGIQQAADKALKTMKQMFGMK